MGFWVWRAQSGSLEDSLEGHNGDVQSVAFRSTGELVTAGEDGALFTWAMGNNWSSHFQDWRREGSAAVMPRDERTLIFDRPDGSLVGISADPQIWLDRACTIAGRGLSEEEWRTVFDDKPYDPVCQAGSSTASQ